MGEVVEHHVACGMVEGYAAAAEKRGNSGEKTEGNAKNFKAGNREMNRMGGRNRAGGGALGKIGGSRPCIK